MPSARISTLFVCRDNTARSRMAAAFLRGLGGGRFEAASAGLESNAADPLAVQVMAELGIELPAAPEPHVFERYLEGLHPEHVVRFAEKRIGERSPIFPGVTVQAEWDAPDPTRFVDGVEERREQFVQLRDRIRTLVASWLVVLEANAHEGGSVELGTESSP